MKVLENQEETIHNCALEHVKVLKNMQGLIEETIFIFDYTTGTFPYISPNSVFWKEEDFSSEQKSISDLLFQKIHSDDVLYQQKTHDKAREFIKKQIPETIPHLIITYPIRLKVLMNVYKNIMLRVKILKTDSSGNILLSMTTVLNANEIKDNKAYIINIQTKEKYSLDKDMYLDSTPTLTKREEDILRLIKSGFSGKEISDNLFISYNTLKSHKKQLYKKLEANNNTELLKNAFLLGLS